MEDRIHAARLHSKAALIFLEKTGGVPVMMGTAIPTDIRYKALTGKEKQVHEGTEKEHHYTDALIKRAIT